MVVRTNDDGGDGTEWITHTMTPNKVLTGFPPPPSKLRRKTIIERLTPGPQMLSGMFAGLMLCTGFILGFTLGVYVVLNAW